MSSSQDNLSVCLDFFHTSTVRHAAAPMVTVDSEPEDFVADQSHLQLGGKPPTEAHNPQFKLSCGQVKCRTLHQHIDLAFRKDAAFLVCRRTSQRRLGLIEWLIMFQARLWWSHRRALALVEDRSIHSCRWSFWLAWLARASPRCKNLSPPLSPSVHLCL